MTRSVTYVGCAITIVVYRLQVQMESKINEFRNNHSTLKKFYRSLPKISIDYSQAIIWSTRVFFTPGSLQKCIPRKSFGLLFKPNSSANPTVSGSK